SPAFLPVTGPRRISEVSTPPQGVRFPSELPTMDDVARSLVEEALSRAGGNQSAAARMIGLTPSAISKRLRGYQPK
ncbi:MAG: helix-turn-helix domain-containing protein, partial [Spirochaetota bacterium]